ncbi:hypothetical protein [Pseudogracilibacillus sp. SO30301A]|uniref:hypothetical protein n=1 Tax=Pseudogracilibacillus sp. SO30301A TaxID=3098291 RepID=UPI00300E2151
MIYKNEDVLFSEIMCRSEARCAVFGNYVPIRSEMCHFWKLCADLKEDVPFSEIMCRSEARCAVFENHVPI